MTCELSRRFLGVRTLHTEEHQIRLRTCCDVGGGRNRNALLKVDAIEKETVTRPHVDVHRASDKCDVGARTSEHPAEVATYRTGTDNCDARPRW